MLLPIKQGPLVSERLILHPFDVRFISQEYVSWLNDPVVCEHNSHGQGTYTLEKAREYFSSVRASDNILVFAVVVKDSGRHIGNISLDHINWTEKTADISILLGVRSEWGKGYGQEAFKTVIAFAKDVLRFSKVSAGMSAANGAMRKVVKALGFECEKILPEAFHKRNQSFDVERWGLTLQ
jgi:RimJ/RimL family protein N-acetyltransferase